MALASRLYWAIEGNDGKKKNISLAEYDELWRQECGKSLPQVVSYINNLSDDNIDLLYHIVSRTGRFDEYPLDPVRIFSESDNISPLKLFFGDGTVPDIAEAQVPLSIEPCSRQDGAQKPYKAFSVTQSDSKGSIEKPIVPTWEADEFQVYCYEPCGVVQKEKEYLQSVWDWEGEIFPLRLDNFVKILQIGQGAYGDVWLAQDVINNRQVALKKLKFNEEREGFPKYFIREVTLLRSLKHENIVKLLGVVFSKTRSDPKINCSDVKNLTKASVWMVFEYLPFDLTGYTSLLRGERTFPTANGKSGVNRVNRWFTMAEIKFIMKQLLEALEYCHRNNIMHRDIKCANLLITSDGTIKLADFGLARKYHSHISTLTNRVITLWYRPPELLLGSENYGTSVDVWSAGCIMGELIRGCPIFAGEKVWDVVCKIVQKLGKPTPTDMKPLQSLPLWQKWRSNPLNSKFPSILPSRTDEFRRTIRDVRGAGELGLDLLYKLLRWNPRERLSASEALAHPWFSSQPGPERLNVAQFSTSAHSFVSRKKKRTKPVVQNDNLPIMTTNVSETRLKSFSTFIDMSKELAAEAAVMYAQNCKAYREATSAVLQKQRAERFRAAVMQQETSKHSSPPVRYQQEPTETPRDRTELGGERYQQTHMRSCTNRSDRRSEGSPDSRYYRRKDRRYRASQHYVSETIPTSRGWSNRAESSHDSRKSLYGSRHINRNDRTSPPPPPPTYHHSRCDWQQDNRKSVRLTDSKTASSSHGSSVGKRLRSPRDERESSHRYERSAPKISKQFVHDRDYRSSERRGGPGSYRDTNDNRQSRNKRSRSRSRSSSGIGKSHKVEPFHRKRS